MFERTDFWEHGMSLDISFFPYQQEFSRYLPIHIPPRTASSAQVLFLNTLQRSGYLLWLLNSRNFFGENFFPHCRLFHHRALLSGSGASDEKLLLGLKGFVFISDNLTRVFQELWRSLWSPLGEWKVQSLELFLFWFYNVQWTMEIIGYSGSLAYGVQYCLVFHYIVYFGEL